jgi:hypothetical protein
VTESNGWRPLNRSNRLSSFDLTEYLSTPFGKLARTHGLGACADGMIAVALAGSIFFSVSPDAARWRVGLYLLLTIAPFAVVTPLIGPALDRVRGGRRMMVIGASVGRMLVAFLMVSHIDSFLLFPEAFAMLVLQKSYSVAKSAIVPTMKAGQDDLVEANSTLALISSVAGITGAAVGAIFLLGGPALTCGVATVVYALTALAATRLPKLLVASEPADETELAELSGSGIRLAASSMGLIRGIVGFLTFLLAFALRGGVDGVDFHREGAGVGVATAASRDVNVIGSPGAPAWHFGVVVVMAGVGTFVGARAAPSLRKRLAEERILLAAASATAFVAVVAMWSGGVFGAASLALCVAASAAVGKLAFDSLVQRDAPDANYGRSFSRFEARFQLTWVIGAVLAVLTPIRSTRFGYFLIACVAAFAAVSYFLSRRTLLSGSGPLQDGAEQDGAEQDDAEEHGDAQDGVEQGEPIEDDGDGEPGEPTSVDTAGELTWRQPEIFDSVTDQVEDVDAAVPDEGVDPSEPADAGPDESRWTLDYGPTVSSVEGVEIDDP